MAHETDSATAAKKTTHHRENMRAIRLLWVAGILIIISATVFMIGYIPFNTTVYGVLLLALCMCGIAPIIPIIRWNAAVIQAGGIPEHHSFGYLFFLMSGSLSLETGIIVSVAHLPHIPELFAPLGLGTALYVHAIDMMVAILKQFSKENTP